MTLYELIEMVDELDKCGIFEIHNMNDFDRGLFDLYDSYSFNGGGFSLGDDYYYFWDGDMISIRESELYDFYESALDELTGGEYEREKHLDRLEILHRFLGEEELESQIKETAFLLEKAKETREYFEVVLESLLDEKKKREA